MNENQFTETELQNIEKIKMLCKSYSDTFLKSETIKNDELVTEFKNLIYSKFNYQEGINQERQLDFYNIVNLYVTNFALDLKRQREKDRGSS